MKAVVALLVLLAAVAASAQQLQYEQSAYTDNAAPVDTPMMEEADVAESSFAEAQAEADGPFSDIAHAQTKAIGAVKALFKKNKSKGGNVSPSAAPKKGWKASKPRRERGSVANKRGAALRNAKPKPAPLKRAIIDPKKAAKKARKQAKKAQKQARKLKKQNKALKKLFARKNRNKRGGKRGGKKLRFPAPPASAKGDHLWHYERFPPTAANGKMIDPEEAKLNLALEAVKEDILSTNKQINDERRWVIAVGKIIKSYNTKMQRVEAHIIALRKEMKSLYRKKKQIENLKLQRALQQKLKEAKAELKTLKNSLSHVARKQGELNRSGSDLKRTIAGIHAQLAKLRGQRLVKKCRAGTRYSRKAKKCKSVCKKGAVFSRKSKKCVSRCRKGLRWNARSRKCVKGGKKGRRAGRGRGRKTRRAARK